MKTLVNLTILILLTTTANSQSLNPFESIGKKGKIITLSNGKYVEVYSNDSLQKIGSVVMNMNTNEVYEFLQIDTVYSEATLDPTITSRWYSIDQLAHVYPSVSPYSFSGNNPVYFIDIDGRVLWDPQAKKEVIFNDETKKFTYKDGSELGETYLKQAMPTLEKLTSSNVGLEIIKSLQAVSTKVIIDENDRQKNSAQAKKANSLITPSQNKNSDGLYEEAVITPIWKNINSSAEVDRMSVDEKLLATMTVEWGHIGTKAQIDLESSLGGPKKMYSDPNAFAQAYNGLLNDAISAEMAYRKEKGIAVDEGVFQPILRVRQTEIGANVKFNDANQKAYDEYKATQH